MGDDRIGLKVTEPDCRRIGYNKCKSRSIRHLANTV